MTESLPSPNVKTDSNDETKDTKTEDPRAYAAWFQYDPNLNRVQPVMVARKDTNMENKDIAYLSIETWGDYSLRQLCYSKTKAKDMMKKSLDSHYLGTAMFILMDEQQHKPLMKAFLLPWDNAICVSIYEYENDNERPTLKVVEMDIKPDRDILAELHSTYMKHTTLEPSTLERHGACRIP